MRKILLLLCAISFTCLGFSQQTKEEKISELMNMAGAGNVARESIKDLLISLKSELPKMPEKFWTKLEAEIKEDEIVKRIIPIYEKHFSEKEIDDILAFYKSETGQKFIQKEPIIFSEAEKLGEDWGKELLGKIMKLLVEENETKK